MENTFLKFVENASVGLLDFPTWMVALYRRVLRGGWSLGFGAEGVTIVAEGWVCAEFVGRFDWALSNMGLSVISLFDEEASLWQWLPSGVVRGGDVVIDGSSFSLGRLKVNFCWIGWVFGVIDFCFLVMVVFWGFTCSPLRADFGGVLVLLDERCFFLWPWSNRLNVSGDFIRND